MEEIVSLLPTIDKGQYYLSALCRPLLRTPREAPYQRPDVELQNPGETGRQ